MTYRQQHAILMDYLQTKVENHDWHGVSDAANDLRVLETEAKLLGWNENIRRIE